MRKANIYVQYQWLCYVVAIMRLQKFVGETIDGHLITNIIAVPVDLPSDIFGPLVLSALGLGPAPPQELYKSNHEYQPLAVYRLSAYPVPVAGIWITDDLVSALEKEQEE